MYFMYSYICIFMNYFVQNIIFSFDLFIIHTAGGLRYHAMAPLIRYKILKCQLAPQITIQNNFRADI